MPDRWRRKFGSRSRSIVDRDDALHAALVIDDRQSQQVVACDGAGRLVRVGVHRDRDRIRAGEVPNPRLGRADDQSPQGDRSDQRAIRLGDVEVVDVVRLRLQLSEPVDDLLRGLVGRDRDEIGRHQATGGLFAIRQELADVLRLLRLHQSKELGPALLGQVGDQVGGLIGAHLLEDVGRPFGRKVVEDVDLVLRGQLLEHIGSTALLERGHDAGPIAWRELLDDVGDIGGVQRGERLVGDAQLEARDARLNRIDVLPFDVVFDRKAKGARKALAGTGQSEPAEDSGQPHVDGYQPESPPHRGELDVVDAHDLPALHVDDLLVLQVEPEADLIRTLLEVGDVDARGMQARTALVDRIDIGPGQEDVAIAADTHDNAGDRRVLLAKGHDQIADPAEWRAVQVEHRLADELAQEEHGTTTSLSRLVKVVRAPRVVVGREGRETASSRR